MLMFRYEPFILALECANVDAAQRLVSCAIAAGFRESGITSCKRRVIVAIRCSIRLEAPIAQDGQLLVSVEYLQFLTRLANEKMVANHHRTEKFFTSYLIEFETPKEHNIEHNDINQFKATKLSSIVESVDTHNATMNLSGKGSRRFTRDFSLAKGAISYRRRSKDSYRSCTFKGDGSCNLEERQKTILLRIRAIEHELSNRIRSKLNLVSSEDGSEKTSAESNLLRHSNGSFQGALSNHSKISRKEVLSNEEILVSAEGAEELGGHDSCRLRVANTIFKASAKALCRWGHTTCSLPATDEDALPFLLVFGGFGGFGRHGRLNDLLVLNLQTGIVEPVQAVNSPHPRMGHTACIIGDTMWVIGGRRDPITPLGDVLAFHIGSLQWNSLKVSGETFYPRHRHAAAVVNTNIYVFGGLSSTNILNDMYVFDTVKLKWSQLQCEGETPDARHSHTLAAIGNTLYLFGGFGENVIYCDLYMLDLQTLIWKKQKLFGNVTGRFSHSCTVAGHHLLFLGGCTSSPQASELGILDTTSMLWRNEGLSSIKNPLLVRHSANLVGSHLVVIGGGVSCYAFGTVFNSSFSYDLTDLSSDTVILRHENAFYLSKDVKLANASSDCQKQRKHLSVSIKREKEHFSPDTDDTEFAESSKSNFILQSSSLDFCDVSRDQLQASCVSDNMDMMSFPAITSNSCADGVCIEQKSVLVMELDRKVAKTGKDALKQLGWLNPTRRSKVLSCGRVVFPLNDKAECFLKPYEEPTSFLQDESTTMTLPSGSTDCKVFETVSEEELFNSVMRCVSNGGKLYKSCMMPSLKNSDPPNVLLKNRLLDLLENHGLSKSLGVEIPKKWERLGDMAILPSDSLRSQYWRLLGQSLWTSVAECLGVSKIARQGSIAPTATRDSTMELLLGENGWVQHRENGILYCFDATKCMFSSGNVSERLRVANFRCNNETIVDLFAGIGYFVLPFLLKTGAQKVYACEWNPNALVALRHNLRVNFVEARCTVIEGDNRKRAPQGVADRVCLGLLPSSEESWEVAVKALRPKGGILHVHGNVKDSEELDWVEYLSMSIMQIAETQGRDWTVAIDHIERVKWYAPHIRHLVADVRCSAMQERSSPEE